MILVRNRVFGRKLSRDTDTRKAMFRSLVAAIVKNGSIITTKAKAKSIQGFLDKLITKVKKNTLASRRKVIAILGNDKETTEKLFGVLNETFAKRKSGFTRIINLPKRRGDLSKMVRLEFVDKYEIKAKSIVKKEVRVGLRKPAQSEGKENENTSTKNS